MPTRTIEQRGLLQNDPEQPECRIGYTHVHGVDVPHAYVEEMLLHQLVDLYLM